MQVYFIESGAIDGVDIDCDLFVKAAGVENAVDCWRDYYQIDDEVSPKRVWRLPDRLDARGDGPIPWSAGDKTRETNAIASALFVHQVWPE